MEKGKMKVLSVMLLAVVVGGCSFIERPIAKRSGYSEAVERPYALEKKTIMADDINMAYMEAGSGPTVILIHGGVIPMSLVQSLIINPMAPVSQSVLHSGAVSTADTWNPNIEALAQNFHVVAVDLPGFGGSDKPKIKYKLEDFVTYLDAFMEAKGIDKAMLVGHGLGGSIAIVYALEYPDKVQKLVLVDSFGAPPGRSILKVPIIGSLVQKQKAAKINIVLPLAKRALGGWEGPAEKSMAMALSQQVDDASPISLKNLVISREGDSGKFLRAVTDYRMAAIASEEAGKEVHALHKAMVQTRRKDLAGRLPEIEVPVLVMNGFYDPVVTQEQAQYMEHAFPRGQLMVYEKSAHYPMVEEAERFNRDVSFFLSSSDVTAESTKK